MVLLRNVKLCTLYSVNCILYIGVNSIFYTFALLNVSNWTRTGSFMQRLSAADLGYGLWKGGANKEKVAVLRIRIRDPE